MNILGIDPSTTNLGIALLNKQNGGEEVLASELFTLTAEQEKKFWLLRCRLLVRQFKAWLEQVALCHAVPDLAVIELPTRNYKTIVGISWAAGQLAAVLQDRNIEVMAIEPYKIKTWLGLNPATRREIVKAIILEYVNIGFDLSITKEEQDKADALVIGLAGIHYWKEGKMK